jgi:beta-glucanase (GH16 family)
MAPVMTVIRIVLIFLLPGYTIGQTNFQELVWSDEFNTNGAPNPAFWSYDIGQSGWGNNEVQNYTNATQNVRVENGLLVIDALKNNGVWSSARIKSQGKKSFTYGRIVFRAKLPAGSGTWPALWLLGESISSVGWPACGEIDVMEHVGKNPGQVLSAIHTPSSFGNTENVASKTVDTYNTQFHTYELRWSTDKLEFVIDDEVYYTYAPAVRNASTWPFDAPQFIIMNIAMGGNLGSDPQHETNGLKNGIDPALTQARMEVDYVRVYQAFTTLRIDGSRIVQKNQSNVSFSTNNLVDATYEWSVPADAQIVGGQGTHQISVNWGVTEGDVQVKVTLDGTDYEKSFPVVMPVKPQGSVFPILSPEFGIAWTDQDPANQYTIVTEGSSTRINYSVSNPSAATGVRGELYRPLDLSDHPVLKARIRAFNKSRTLNMRMDLMDENGIATTKSPVFNLFPVIDDGEWYTYTFNYNTENGWLSNTQAVNPEKITQVNFYINFGTFGKVGSDSLWIDALWVEDETSPPGINRPSHLTAGITQQTLTLGWKDNSTTETGFEIFRSANPDGPYQKIEILPAQTTSYTNSIDDSETRYYYRVRAFNEITTSDFSNTVEPEWITSIEYDPLRFVQVYPNPNSGKFFMEHTLTDAPQICIKNLTGTLVHRQRLNPMYYPQEIDLSEAAKGPYIIELRTRHQTAYKKIFIY